MKLRKAVIPAAGFGTRMLPAAKAVPKEMLPILDRPTIQYVVQEAADAGLSDITLITAAGKKSIEDHFASNPALEERLKGDKAGLLDSVRQLMQRMSITPVVQARQRGLGDAVFQARQRIGDEPFVCLLGDTVFSGNPGPAAQLVEAHRTLGTAIIGLEEVPAEKVSRYGIVGGTMLGDGILKLGTILEKPDPASAPSRLAVAARYLLTPAIFDCLGQTAPGKGGEIQLTDAIARLMQRETVHGLILRGTRHDIGNPIDWLKTNLIFAQRDAALWAQLQPLLHQLLKV